MADPDLVAGPQGAGDLRYSGYFDWPGLYNVFVTFAANEMMKIYETLYKDKTSGEGFAEREIEMTIDKKVDRLYRYQIKIAVKLWDCQEVDVKQNGVTKKMTRGRLRVRIVGIVQMDQQNKFQISETMQKMWTIYKKLTLWDYNFNHWDIMYAKQYELQAQVKAFLGLDTLDSH
jgi:hypothetical protein